jgi:hypothetical protein
MNFSKSCNSRVRCWGMNKTNSVNWRGGRTYSVHWGSGRHCFYESTKFNRRYRSVHWSEAI